MISRLLIVFIFSITTSLAQENRDFGGTIEAEIDGKIVYFPLLKSDIQANIQGDLATVEITQTFNNPSPVPLNARYLFPMNKDSAVYAMTMEVGDRLTRAIIKRKEEARATYEQAKADGKAASLLTQHRPNMFTQEVANLMPGLPVKITIKYSQIVPKIDGDYELVVPLIVGPRYQPANIFQSDADHDADRRPIAPEPEFGTWELDQLPYYPPVNGITLPKSVDPDRVSISVNINSSLKIENIYSDTHDVNNSGNDNDKSVSLAAGSIIDNKDFVLRYSLAGEDVQAGFISTKTEEEGGYFSLLIEPPAMPDDTQIARREMVFVLDTSGSMRGQPLSASKVFMRHALDNLREGDHFRIISFNNTASEYSNSPQAATPSNIRSGLRFIDALHGGGGTEIGTSITQAFKVPPKPGTMRIVVFLTDGYIGNEHQIFSQLDQNVSNARIYAFGVGSSVNRYLLSEMGRRGRGFARFIDPTENPDDVAVALAKKLNAPVLTDINIDFGDLSVTDVTPSVIPDLFAGDSIRIQGKYVGTGHKTIRVTGLVNNREATLPMQVQLADETDVSKESIPIIWARSTVADKMRLINSPQFSDAGSVNIEETKEDVIQLGLSHALVTQWTSFVAVDEEIINDNPDKTKDSDVVLPKVAGVENSAYGSQEYLTEIVQQNPSQVAVLGTRVRGRTATDSMVMAEVAASVSAAPAGLPNISTTANFAAPVSPGPEPLPSTPPQFAGGKVSTPIAHMPAASTPEPGVLGGLLLLSIMGFFALRRGKRG